MDGSFEYVPGTWVYAKVRSLPDPAEHFLVARDSDEITVVTSAENLPALDLIERNAGDWTLIAIRPPSPFYAVGFLAAITAALAARGLDVLVISTYSKDYVLVPAGADARPALIALGLRPA